MSSCHLGEGGGGRPAAVAHTGGKEAVSASGRGSQRSGGATMERHLSPWRQSSLLPAPTRSESVFPCAGRGCRLSLAVSRATALRAGCLAGQRADACVCVCVCGWTQTEEGFAVTASPCPCGADGARPWLAGLATTTCSHAAAPWVAYTCRQPERRPSGGKPVKRLGEACRVGLLWARLLGGSSQRRSRPGGGPQAHARGRGSFQSGKRRLSAGGTDGSRQHRRSGEEGERVTCAGRTVY